MLQQNFQAKVTTDKHTHANPYQKKESKCGTLSRWFCLPLESLQTISILTSHTWNYLRTRKFNYNIQRLNTPAGLQFYVELLCICESVWRINNFNDDDGDDNNNTNNKNDNSCPVTSRLVVHSHRQFYMELLYVN